MTTTETHVADLCPHCNDKREIRVVHADGRRSARLPPHCKTKEACERELSSLTEAGG